jgi:hypothetical protein
MPAFKIGTSPVSAVKIGTLSVTKIMLGIQEVWSDYKDPAVLFTGEQGSAYDFQDDMDAKAA